MSDERNKKTITLENETVDLVRNLMAAENVPQSRIPIFTLHVNKPAERSYCEKTLGIHPADVFFVGVAEYENNVVKRVIYRQSGVTNPVLALQRIGKMGDLDSFDPVAAMATPTPPPSPSPKFTPVNRPSPHYTPPYRPVPPPAHADSGISLAVTASKHVDRGTQPDLNYHFGIHDTIYAYAVVSDSRPGSILNCGLYAFGSLVRRTDGRVRLIRSSAHSGAAEWGNNFWFVPEKTGWQPGEYEVRFWLDGRAARTVRFNVGN